MPIANNNACSSTGPYQTAVYTPKDIPDSNGNPLVEALPPVLSPKQIKLKERRMRVPEEILALPTHQREFSAVPVMNQVRLVTRQVIELEQSISMILNHGYLWRNPLQSEAGKPDAKALSLFNLPGAGVTTALDIVLEAYPRIIIHTQYADKPLYLLQLPYIRISIQPEDGKLSTFQQTILAAIYQTLKLHHTARIPDLSQTVVEELRNYHVGLLIVEDIDRLQSKQSCKSILNYLVSLNDNQGIPILVTGAYEAGALLQRHLEIAFSMTSEKTVHSFLLPYDIHWSRAIEAFWEALVLKDPPPFQESYSRLLFAHSQGLIGLAKRILVETEIYALQMKRETFTEKDLEASALRCMEYMADELASFIETSNSETEAILQAANLRQQALPILDKPQEVSA